MCFKNLRKGRYKTMTNKEKMTIVNSEATKSAKMKALYNEGCEIGEIAKLLGVRYNFVYNVISNAAMKAGEEVRVTRKNGSRKAAIIALIEEGKTNKEISQELGVLYNYVFKVRKDYEATQAAQA